MYLEASVSAWFYRMKGVLYFLLPLFSEVLIQDLVFKISMCDNIVVSEPLSSTNVKNYSRLCSNRHNSEQMDFPRPSVWL